MKEKIIHLDKINKIYENGIQAVFDFSLKIKDKEFIALVGPSGCGKSTTLRMIAGLENISYGELFFDGEVMNSVSSKNRNIAMVFQNYALYPHMNIYENMAFSLKTRKYPKEKIHEKVEWAAKILNLENYLNRRPKDLSGGQRQRVALGRAIVRNPRIFLMDEPLSNLDAKLRTQMRTEIKQLHKKLQSTTIYVTHDQVEAMTMADRIVVMKDGFVNQVGTPKELFDSPSNVFVAKFIGAPEINLFPGIIKDNYFISKNKKIKLKLDKYQIPKNSNNQEVILGIRPYDAGDDLLIKETYGDTKLNIQIISMENLGTEMICYGKLDNNEKITFISKGRYNDLKYGQSKDIYLNKSKIMFFDSKTKINITSPLNVETKNALEIIKNREYDFQIKNELLENQANKKTIKQIIVSYLKKSINSKLRNKGTNNE